MLYTPRYNGASEFFADILDAMREGETIHTETRAIMRTGIDTYNVEPAVNGRAYLSMMEVIDVVASEVAA